MNQEQQESPEILCPHCSAEAHWCFVDETEQMVEITCSDCGRFEIPKLELERAEFDLEPVENRRE